MTTQAASSWRWFPAWLGLAMAGVFAVNGYMAYDAVTTFPGAAGQDGFDLSKNYAQVMEAETRQAALGWNVTVNVNASRYPVLRLAAHNGATLAGAAIEAQAERPVGPKVSTALLFHPLDDGSYQAGTSLSFGQWDIMLTIHNQGQTFTATRRVIVR